jgi:hypothetical protein
MDVIILKHRRPESITKKNKKKLKKHKLLKRLTGFFDSLNGMNFSVKHENTKLARTNAKNIMHWIASNSSLHCFLNFFERKF